MACVRLIVGAGVLLAASAAVLGSRTRTGESDRQPQSPLSRTPSFWAAAAGMAAYQVLFFVGVSRAGVAVGTLASLALAPVMAGLLGIRLGAGKPDRLWWAATALAVVGLFLLTGMPTGAKLTGVLAAVGAGAGYAAFTAFSGRAVSSGHPASRVLAGAFSAAALVTLPLLVGHADWLATGRGALLALYLGVVATGLAYILFGHALGVLQPGVIATINLAEPVTATMLGVGLLGESLGASGLAGAALILAGILAIGRSAGRAD